jgi:hypothetical protein
MKAKAIILVALMFVGISSVAIANNPAEPAAAPALNNTITGVVLDKTTGESLTGVEVRVEGTDLKTYTDFDGKFVFENVKAGEYKVMANYISYGINETKPIKVNSNELHALNLQMETLDK